MGGTVVSDKLGCKKWAYGITSTQHRPFPKRTGQIEKLAEKSILTYDIGVVTLSDVNLVKVRRFYKGKNKPKIVLADCFVPNMGLKEEKMGYKAGVLAENKLTNFTSRHPHTLLTNKTFIYESLNSVVVTVTLFASTLQTDLR
jgi:hypothetical protein